MGNNEKAEKKNQVDLNIRFLLVGSHIRHIPVGIPVGLVTKLPWLTRFRFDIGSKPCFPWHWSQLFCFEDLTLVSYLIVVDYFK